MEKVDGGNEKNTDDNASTYHDKTIWNDQPLTQLHWLILRFAND